MEKEVKINYELLSSAIRALTIDATSKANSGHPGMPMGMAEIGVVLWRNHLNHNPLNPKWINRDRFVLSNGHGSMLLYSLLHLTGYNLTINDLKEFRQFKSKTPGHPKNRYTEGVETTTGCLGQGLANGVGLALAEKSLAAEFNKNEFKIIDHYTYVFVGDGCLMEGISHEVCSLAGTLQLENLIVIYDSNGISIDGDILDWFDEDVEKRFLAYNWNVVNVLDGHNPSQIDSAIKQCKQKNGKPSLIICKTIIGKGSPNKAGTKETHGSPFNSEEKDLIRKQIKWDYDPFVIPEEVYQQFDCTQKGSQLEEHWINLFELYEKTFPEFAIELKRRIKMEMPQNFNEIILRGIEAAKQNGKDAPTRKSSEFAIEYYSKFLPELFGGSADLTVSNLTKWSNAKLIGRSNDFIGNYINYGVREFGMSAMLNGIFLYGGFRPFAGTFLIFSEYARNAVRMACIMKIAPIFVYTHDSVGVGEDGATHQPIEQIASLRLTPNINVWRPCDIVESMVAWGVALSQNNTPSCLIFSRQLVKFIQRSDLVIQNISKGGYILNQNSSQPELVIMATGSEVELAEYAYEELSKENILVQLVSMPCLEIFNNQDEGYKNLVLARKTSKFIVCIEAGVSDPWYKYVADKKGLILGINTFGECGTAKDNFEYFGLTRESVLKQIKNFIS